MKVKAFPALTPAAGKAEQVASVPYDVVNTAEARALAEGNPHSFLHVLRAEIEATVRAIHKIETAIEPKFQEHFVNASAMPNAVDPFPILNSIVKLPSETFNTGSDGGESGGRRRRRRA